MQELSEADVAEGCSMCRKCELFPNRSPSVPRERFFLQLRELFPDPLGKGNGSTVAEQGKKIRRNCSR